MIGNRSGQDVVLDYYGVRAIYHVPATYTDLNLPLKYLSSYIGDNSLNKPDSDKFARFKPTGKEEIHEGRMLPIWVFDKEVDL